MPKVSIWRDGAIEIEFDTGHRDWRIGRSETNDITLLDPRKSVSRFHAEIREENGRWVFIDLSSQNGSWNRDGQRVSRVVLDHGRDVLFGDYRLAFEDTPRVAPPPMPAEPGVDTAPHVPTAPVVVPPQETHRGTGTRSSGSTGTAPSAGSSSARPAQLPSAPRKGINPAVLLGFLLLLLGVGGALAWRIVTDTAAPAQGGSEPAANTVAAAEEPPRPPSSRETESPSLSPDAAAASPAATSPQDTNIPDVAAADTAVGQQGSPPPTPSAEVRPQALRPGPTATTARPKRAPVTAADAPSIAALYADGRRAFERGRYAEAQRALEAVVAQNRSFRDSAALLKRAEAAETAARERALGQAEAAASAGEWVRAITLYERAGAAEQAGAARGKMHAAGEDAYRKARQFDARNRPTEAIGFYEQAVAWLAEGDARKATARERLAALKGGGA